jgi:CrcB protein
MIAAGILLFGAAGAVARYVIDGTVTERVDNRLPYGTLAVNVIGSFILGFVTGLVLYHDDSTTIRTLVGTGFCGAFTTWSTLSWETLRLVEEGDTGAAAVTVFGGIATSMIAAAIGLALATL